MSGRVGIITARETSRLLDVSEATVRNWVRHGYLSPVQKRPQAFCYKDVLTLKQHLAAGKINRLTRRANRSRLARRAIAAEYVDDAGLVRQAQTTGEIVATGRLDPEKALFCLAARLLVLRKTVRLDDPARLFQADAYFGWRQKNLKNELLDWLADLKPLPAKVAGTYLKLYQSLASMPGDDFLGLMYQSLRQEGKRSQRGMYYTPQELLAGMFGPGGAAGGRFVDPCCGTGRFLMAAAGSGRFSPQDLVGFDNDPVAVRIARINLLLAFGNREFTPQIFRLDVLDPEKIRPYRGHFHLIATNPPWGAGLDPSVPVRLQKAYPFIASKESFSCFLAVGLDLLAPGGRLSFILPESFLFVRAHRNIRRHLLSTTTLARVVFLGRRFGGVLSAAIRIDVIKKAPGKKASTRVTFEDGQTHRVSLSRFSNNEHYIIDARLTEAEAAIIKKLTDFPHVTLKNGADWALGIVTGDNRQYLSAVHRKGLEPVFRGKDIEKYRLKSPGVFIRFTPERFQQTAPAEKYRAEEKLVYRFVSRRLVFALDQTGSLTLNSANILIPKIDGYPLKAVLGVLNSSVSQFVYLKKFHALKVLRGDLECLPLPLLGSKRMTSLERLVNRAMAGEDAGPKIDDLIMTGMGLTEKEKQIVLAGVR
jgi:tRNA1(Val) A37 N6-methylase TrmN6